MKINNSLISSAAGVFIIFAGLLLPPSLIIELLRSNPPDISGQLFLGSTFFKGSLVILGLMVIVLGKVLPGARKIYEDKTCKERRKEIASTFLIITILVAFLLRIYRLNDGLWYDEIVTYVKYLKFPIGHIITTYDNQNNHLLYTVLTRFFVEIFGGSAWSIRLPAVIFGVGSIWAIFQLGRLVSNSLEGFLASLLLTFSYHHIWFSQDARGYTGLLFWTIFSSWLLLRGIYENNPKILILYAVAVALGMYTHMTMIVVVFGQLVMYLVVTWGPQNKFQQGRWSGFFYAFVLAGFFTLFLYSLVLPQIFKVFERTENAVLTWRNPIWAVLELLKGLQITFGGSILAIIAMAIILLGFYSYIRNGFAIALLFVIPVLLLLSIIMIKGYTLFPRLFFFAVGYGALIVIRGVMVLGEIIAKLLRLDLMGALRTGTVLCVGMICISAISIPSVYAPKQDYQGALKFVEENRAVSDAVVTVGIPVTLPYKQFFNVDWEPVETLGDLNAIRSHAKRTWLLYSMPVHFESAYPEILRNIRTDFTVIRKFYGSLNGGTIYVCRSKARISWATSMDNM